ncbi:N-acetylmuramoyl-L-alanine amidase [Mobilitalea sibirica]|uniref:N-acetylmuramoyl-L-alanine amidase n=1 Tax=Mobilitalea sibirica TaxID=1462919 RepID=A0A8J7KVS8_9FIRM|nr:N-acetylmuramoyl-L-alanine amidase [Mobilitalea sibirica]MBH1940495.1 N-acetylmuramoyl-L-alanine amidase [Mobilitalea sibirica]
MDKSLLKKAAVQSVALMLAVITLSYAIRQYNAVTILASDIQNTEDMIPSDKVMIIEKANHQLETLSDLNNQVAVKQSVFGENKDFKDIDMELVKQLDNRMLIVKKPQGENITIQMEDLYITKSILITLWGLDNTDLHNGMIGRLNQDKVYVGSPYYTEIESTQNISSEDANTEIIRDYQGDPAHNITVTSWLDELTKKHTMQILIEMDNVYAHILHEDDAYYYIELKNPKEHYNKILVIDAGHGGKDAGAISKDEKTYEKEINLNIVLALKQLLDKEDIKVYYTRLTDETRFLRPRVTLANAVDSDFFISIHCNANDVTSPNGTEILYYDNEFKNIKTKELAQIMSEELAKSIPLKNRGLIKKQKDDIFILEHAVVPAALIEVGYLSNVKDISYLRKNENIQEVARGIYNGIMRAYEEYYPE